MLKEFFQRRSLRKDASAEPTGLLPLKAVRSAVAFIDVEDPSFDAAKNALLAFFRENSIKADIFFFDFRRLGKDERLITSINTTVLRKDLNWFGRPSREKVNLMLSGEPDLFISLLPENSFPLEYMACCSRARFKIGRKQLPGNILDLVALDPPGAAVSQAAAFPAIVGLLEKIK